MTALVVLHVEIDDAKPLGPQLVAARAQAVPWKVLAAKLGCDRRQLRRLMERAIEAEADNFGTDRRAPASAMCARSAG